VIDGVTGPIDRAAAVRAVQAALRDAARLRGRRFVRGRFTELVASAQTPALPPPSEARHRSPRAGEASGRGSGGAEAHPPRSTPAARDPAATHGAQIAQVSDVAGREALRRRAAAWTPEHKLSYLRAKVIGDCRRCPLARGRTSIVFGTGSPRAEILFVGEGPGAEEDRRGEPFVGPAGARLDAFLDEVGLSRDQVYIANVVKCRPPGNRDPRPAEVDACAPFLRAQIRAIDPKVIVALGRHAAMFLSGRHDLSLGRLRGKPLRYRDPKLGNKTIPIVATYHPAFILRKDASGGEQARFAEMVVADLRRARSIASRSPER